MGWGSAGTPPWVDAKNLDEEKLRKKVAQDAAKIKALEEENEALKKRVQQLEDEIKRRK
jgi:cell division protein FtsB